MTTINKKMTAICPDCDKDINLGPRPTMGHKLVCPYCEAYLELVNLDPPELTWDMGEFDDDDDWDDDDWSDDDDDNDDDGW